MCMCVPVCGFVFMHTVSEEKGGLGPLEWSYIASELPNVGAGN